MSNMAQNINWKEEKEKEKKVVFKMIDDSAKDIVISPAKLKNYLKLQGQFDRYSVSNVLLINKQKPSASKLRDFEGWAKEDRHILKGQKGISIIHPEKYTRQDGTEGVSYQIKKIFDVTQVSGIEKGSFPPGRDRIVNVLLQALPYKMQEVPKLDFQNNGAYYQSDEECLYVVSGAKNEQYFLPFLSLEIGYAEIRGQFPFMDDTTANFLGKCVACEVCSRYGQNIDLFEFDDIPESWKVMQPKDIRKQLDTIRAAANRIIVRTNEILYHRSKETEQAR